MSANMLDNEYWNRQSIIDKDINILALGLVEYKNALTNSEEIIKKIEDLDKKIIDNKGKTILKSWSARSYKYDNADTIDLCLSKPVLSSKELTPKDIFYKENSEISDFLNIAIDNGLKKYFDVYPRAEKNVKTKERFPKLLKYSAGNNMPPHSDHGVTSRVISCILYLNDNYSGGELYFPYLDVLFKPTAGSVVFFPSNFIYTHEVKKINSGTRYSYPNWFHNVDKQFLPENPNSVSINWREV